MAATDQQVQNFVDQRIRPRCEQIRNLLVAMQDDVAAIGDVYANLTATSPPTTWTDNRTDGPPRLALPTDVLAVNTVLHDLITAISSDAQYSIVESLCVRPVE